VVRGSFLVLGLVVAACAERAVERPAPPGVGDVIDVPGGSVTTERGVVRVARFGLDRTPVTVEAFRAFVAASGYAPVADFAGGSVLDLSSGAWRVVPGATWEHPLGVDAPAALADHPVTQVSFLDAVAFCASRGARLPTEDEWEHAARNARDDRTAYPWGDDPAPAGVWRLNVWQGSFPAANTLADGHLFTSAVGAFPPTELGFVDLVGNVWQWTTSRFDGGEARALRGGSFLCEPSVCHGYRIDGRQEAEPMSAWMHVGFRCAYER
jgi:sulfatase modifying factor 1